MDETVLHTCCLADQGSPSVMQYIVSVKSSSLLLHSFDIRFLLTVMFHLRFRGLSCKPNSQLVVGVLYHFKN